MTKVQKMEPIKLSEAAYSNTIHQLNSDLLTGKMWMNTQCKTQNKDPRLIRWIKYLLSQILPFNLYSSIKVSRVAFQYFEFVKIHQDYLVDSKIFDKTKEVLETLNVKTHKKYSNKLQAYLYAIDGLELEAYPVEEEGEEVQEEVKGKVQEASKEKVQEKQNLGQTIVNRIKNKISPTDDKKISNSNEAKKNFSAPEEFDALLGILSQYKAKKERYIDNKKLDKDMKNLEQFKKEYSESDWRRKEVIAANLKELEKLRSEDEFKSSESREILHACIAKVEADMEAQKPPKNTKKKVKIVVN